jgi:hypothetical protein
MENNEVVPPEVAQTKGLRKELDEVLQRLKIANTPNEGKPHVAYPSREKALAITKLQEAIMWLGMDLKGMREAGITGGTENPYPDSYNPQSPVIEPTADGLSL